MGSAPTEQIVRVEVTAGRAKWAELGISGAKIGRQLPTTTYEWTLSLQEEGPLAGCWLVDQIAPDAPLAMPLGDADPTNAAGASLKPAPTPTAETALTVLASLLLMTVGRWLGEQTGVFGASLDPVYVGDATVATTLQNLLD